MEQLAGIAAWMVTTGSGARAVLCCCRNTQTGLFPADLAQHFFYWHHIPSEFLPNLLFSGTASLLTKVPDEPNAPNLACHTLRGYMGTVKCLPHHIGAKLAPQDHAVALSLLWCSCTGKVGGSLQGNVSGFQMKCGANKLPEFLSIHLAHGLSPDACPVASFPFPSPVSSSGSNGTLWPKRLGSLSGPPGLSFLKGRDWGTYKTLPLETKLGFQDSFLVSTS